LGTRSSSKAWSRALALTAPIASNPKRILPAVIGELAGPFGDAPALLSDVECWTYRALAGRSNQYARWALERGLARGDVVCLLMPNRPEYLAIWLGLSGVGVVVALLNTHLSGPPLAHCVDLVAPRLVIAASELVDSLAATLPALSSAPSLWAHGAGRDDLPRVDREVERHSGQGLSDAERRPVTVEDCALYVYTSGTTGLPKAARVSHARLMQWSHWFAGIMDTRASDRMYDCLPMYHGVGGVSAIASVLVSGGSVVIRNGFSARRFWSDIVRWDCTLFQYIGELCRYLLQTEPHPSESRHGIRLCAGNGLRGDIWERFESRFRIPRILEFYASTEGNVAFFNVEGKPGAVGRIPPYLAHRFPAALVKWDPEHDRPLRDERGFCVRCASGEVGEAIGELGDPSNVGSRFDGYTSWEATEAKILRNVFRPGDAWFRSGDLMRRDDQGYFYFVDRIGDTFRWKGENVSTSEVSEAICAFPGVEQASVYGVAIPGTDGRAGMATLVVRGELDLQALRAHLRERLPAYARPLFLRFRNELERTATFKHTKKALVREGYDPIATADPIYFDDPERQAFVRLDQALHDRINSGRVRL
jgi:fatty-acyl-CoA synthase